MENVKMKPTDNSRGKLVYVYFSSSLNRNLSSQKTIQKNKDKVKSFDSLKDYKLARGWTRISPCKSNCYLKITQEDQDYIFKLYWQEATFQSRINFVKDLTEIIPNPNFHKNPTLNTKSCRIKYYFDTCMRRTEVCKSCFRHILNESNGFITTVLTRKLLEITKGESLTESSPLTDMEMKSLTLRNEKLQKNWTPLFACKNDCHLLIPTNDQNRIFYSYWQEGTFHSRFNFVTRMIKIISHSSCDKCFTFQKNKHQIKYYLDISEGPKEVCHRCFCIILDESPVFIRKVFEKKLEMNVVEECNESSAKESEQEAELSHHNESEIQDSFVDLATAVNISEEELIEEINSLLSNDDPLSPNTEQQSSKGKDEKSMKARRCDSLRKQKLRKGWTKLFSCKKKCHLIPEDDQKRIYYSYWKRATFSSRFKFIYDMTEIEPRKRYHYKNRICYIRQYNATFYLDTSVGREKVCRYCFRATLKESDRFIVAVLDRKWRKIDCKVRVETLKRKRKRVTRNNVKALNNIHPDDEGIEFFEEHTKKSQLSFSMNQDAMYGTLVEPSMVKEEICIENDKHVDGKPPEKIHLNS